MNLFSATNVLALANTLVAPDLAACVQDAIARQDTGELPEGPLRALAGRLVVECDVDERLSLAAAEAVVLREAALRFLAQFSGRRDDTGYLAARAQEFPKK